VTLRPRSPEVGRVDDRREMTSLLSIGGRIVTITKRRFA
jgi:hypothetical protein